jgi:Flp pilus assembly pilin Flp
MLKARSSQDRGAGLAEYALLLFVVAVAAATIITTFGQDIVAAFQDAITALPSGTP